MEKNCVDMNLFQNCPATQDIAILIAIAIISMELMDDSSSSSESDDELELMNAMKRKKKLPKLKNFVEDIVPMYDDQGFKSHFR